MYITNFQCIFQEIHSFLAKVAFEKFISTWHKKKQYLLFKNLLNTATYFAKYMRKIYNILYSWKKSLKLLHTVTYSLSKSLKNSK